MATKIFQKDYEIEYFHVDQNQHLKIQSFLDLINNASFLQSETLGCGINVLAEQNLTWVFCKMEVTLHRAPTFEEKIQVKTYALGSRRYFASRQFDIHDEEGNLIAMAQGLYFLIDTHQRKPVKIPNSIMECYGEDFKTEHVCLRHLKLESTTSETLNRTFRVRHNEIDTNGHVNNGVYVVWATETVPAYFHSSYQLVKLQVNYEKEVFYDDIVNVSTLITGTKEAPIARHTLRIESGEIVCLINTYWQ